MAGDLKKVLKKRLLVSVSTRMPCLLLEGHHIIAFTMALTELKVSRCRNCESPNVQYPIYT